MDEDLLANRFNFEGRDALVGWVEKDDGIPWNTALGLRPRAGFKAPTQLGVATQSEEGTLIPGGPEWFRTDERLPVLDWVEVDTSRPNARPRRVKANTPRTPGTRRYWEVAGPTTNVYGFEGGGSGGGSSGLEDKTRVDVFFLLDGTKSMAPFRDEALEAAKEIARELPAQHSHQDAKFRFGFRVFRDRKDGTRTLGDGLALPASDCGADAKRATRTGNLDDFVRELGGVTMTAERRGDFYEEIYEGLHQAAWDMRGCPKHLKLLFVIGDAGDRLDRLPDKVVKRFAGFEWVVPVFVRTASRVTLISAEQRQEYIDAYGRFVDAGRQLIAAVYSRDEAAAARSDLFIQLGTPQLVERVRKAVATLAPTQPITALATAMRNGEPVDSFMTELRAQQVTPPIIYWKMLRKNACRAAGKQCTERINHGVTTFFVPESAPVVQEVWMKDKSLRNITAVFSRLGDTTARNPEEMKVQFIKHLAEQLEQFIGRPPVALKQSYGAYIRERVNWLPVDENSAFMQYGEDAVEAMKHCVVRRLRKWLIWHGELLNEIQNAADHMPKYAKTAYPHEAGCQLDDKSRRILAVSRDGREPLCPKPGECSLKQQSHGELVWWVPRDLFP